MEETSERAAIPLRLRRAGRVIVLDPQDRVLLFRYDDGPPNGTALVHAGRRAERGRGLPHRGAAGAFRGDRLE